ncbi:DUF4402 domain-containing protein [Algoriphagus sp. D3-2-R+10]|uniref:DUF4402 domain-containing protein n=1 Tax=Algoriphagus aurantiacus TaxID=3103948 RepID=UPI002B3D9DBC|nr:DUF4402 domain-containing protein [Algoriphagus sp. D3-2-R+10]MEB2778291.1 DUF4402 domain-containing protein [Algoriphagus sp. D3-2-R+10]
MKINYKILPAIALLVVGLAFSATAQTGDPVEGTATATATIITPLTLTHVADMNFGNITATTAGGTVILAPAGGRTASGVQLPGTTGTVAAASFTVAGEASYAYTVNLPTAHTITKAASTETMSLGTFTSSLVDNTASLDGTGAGAFTVGSTLTVGASQASGTYTNATGFTVSVVYN